MPTIITEASTTTCWPDTGTTIINDPWPIWVATTETTTSTTGVWPMWCSNSSPTTSTSITSGVWLRWVTSSGRVVYSEPHSIAHPTATPEQLQEVRAARLEREREMRERCERQHKEHLAAVRRAEELLVEHLSPQQRKDYRKFGAFNVVSLSGQRYRINKGRIANVHVLDERARVLHRLCAHPGEFVPDPDTMLAQKFLLECAEGEALFLRKANRHAA